MSALLASGLQLMLVGMGTVFVFLTLLVFATAAMSRLILRYFPEPLEPVPAPTSGAAQQAQDVAAISAALVMHRRRRSGNRSS